MPLDSSIPLQSHPIQGPDLLGSVGQVLQLRHLIQAGKMQDIQTQEAQADFEDQQKLRQAYKESGGDLAAFGQKAAAAGVGPKAMQAINAQFLATREKLAKINTDELAALKTKNEMVGGAMQTVMQAPPDQRPALYQQARAKLLADGTVKPEQAPEQYPGDESMATLANSGRTSQQMIESVIKEREAAAREKTAQTGATRLQLETPGIAAGNTIKAQEAAGTKPIQPAEQLQIAGQAAGRAETARHNTVEEGQGAARIGVERGRLGIEQKRFNATLGSGLDASGQPLPPDALKQRASGNPAAVAIAEYRMRPPQVRNGIVPPVMRDVLAINPTYDATQFDARNAYRKALTSGAQGQALNSLNTAIEHLDQFSEMAKALGNGAFQPGNRLTNWIKATFGDSAPTNFDGMKTIMAGELASAFKKSGATDQEIHSVTSAIDRANSPNQLVDYATKVAIPALGGKIRTYEDQTKAQMGEKDPLVNQIVTPSARQVLGKYGSNVSGGGQGAVQYKQTATGKNGHKIGSNDGRTWFDLQTGKQLQ